LVGHVGGIGYNQLAIGSGDGDNGEQGDGDPCAVPMRVVATALVAALFMTGLLLPSDERAVEDLHRLAVLNTCDALSVDKADDYV